jgi:hypothetical protein
VIPSIILGKGRSVLLQFFLCLTLALVAVSLEDILALMIGTKPTAQLQTLSAFFQNPFVARLYLSVPYLLMLYLDIRSRKRSKKREEMEKAETAYLGEVSPEEQEENKIVAFHITEEAKNACMPESKGRMSFLHGASLACFLLAFITFWLGDALSSNVLPVSLKLVYIAMLLSLGVVLLGLGHYSKNAHRETSI